MVSLNRRSEVRDLLDRMTLGVVKTLDKKPGVTEVQLLEKKPVDKSAIFSWEQKNSCFLPNDLKDFYLTTDGISIQWSIQFHGAALPIGDMVINSLSDLTSLNQSQTITTKEKPSLLDLDDLSDEDESQGNNKPHFDDRSKCFELDSCAGFAKVCLVYKDIKAGITDCTPEIWFLDRSLCWTFLASSFQCYFRMLIVHLGLPLWQYRFTSAGLSPETKQWFNMYAPDRLDNDDETKANNDVETKKSSTEELLHVNQLDVTKVFKGKQDFVKHEAKQRKKKSASNSKTNLSSRFGTSGFKPLYRN